MKRLILIDGNAILHRAYHALPPLTSPEGKIVNAVYGFTSMMIRLFSDMKPQYMVVTFDRPTPTFRKKLYKDYQASRPKMDDALSAQIPVIHDVVHAMKIPIYEFDGYEADDVMGTIVHQVKKSVDEIIIATGDRDIFQLVEDGKVFVYMPTKGLSEAKLYGEKEVQERMGIVPKQITDLKGLIGDSSDNYPGVDGIGPKTAITLLTKYHTVEELYKLLDDGTLDASAGTKEKLIHGREHAFLSKDLATIRTDVPIEVALQPTETLVTPDLKLILEDLHFYSLLKRLAGSPEKATQKKDTKKTTDDNTTDGEQLSLV